MRFWDIKSCTTSVHFVLASVICVAVSLVFDDQNYVGSLFVSFFSELISNMTYIGEL